MKHLTHSIILRTDIKDKAGLCPLYIRFRFENYLTLPLHIKVNPGNFENQKIIYKPGLPLTQQMVHDHNILIDQAKIKVHNIVFTHRSNEVELTRENFKKEFENYHLKGSFYSWVENEIKNLKAVRAPSSITAYNVTVNHLKEFNSNLTFASFTPAFVKEFDRFLQVKKKLNPNTRWRNHKDLKMFLNLAKFQGIKLNDDATKFKTQRNQTQREYLTKEELQLLYEEYCSGYKLSPHLKNVLQYFLFSCFCGGIRISDLKHLTTDNINGKTLKFFVVKNKRFQQCITLQMNESAANLITATDGKLFNTISDQKTNEALKEIARAVEIKKNLSSHVARHTFATQFLSAGGKVEVLQQILGHQKIETTMVYVHISSDVAGNQMLLMDNIPNKVVSIRKVI